MYLFIYFWRERKRGRKREKHLLVASHVSPTGDPAHNPGMCPDWELNWQIFSPQAGA